MHTHTVTARCSIAAPSPPMHQHASPSPPKENKRTHTNAQLPLVQKPAREAVGPQRLDDRPAQSLLLLPACGGWVVACGKGGKRRGGMTPFSFSIPCSSSRGSSFLPSPATTITPTPTPASIYHCHSSKHVRRQGHRRLRQRLCPVIDLLELPEVPNNISILALIDCVGRREQAT